MKKLRKDIIEIQRKKLNKNKFSQSMREIEPRLVNPIIPLRQMQMCKHFSCLSAIVVGNLLTAH